MEIGYAMTGRQRAAFFRLLARAADRQGVPPAAREAWRRAVIREAVPVSGGSLRAVGTGADCDRLMAAVARLAEDHRAAMRWGTAEGRRLAAMAEACARQCFEIARAVPSLAGRWAPGPVAYLRGVLAQAGWRDALHAEGALVPMRRAFALRARYVLTLRALVRTEAPAAEAAPPPIRVREAAGEA